MAAYGLPVAYALFVWWFSTGLILWLDGLPPRTYRRSLLAATAVALLALYGLAAGSTDASVGGAYLAFTCGVLVWGWHELSFLMGFVTGSRRTACPAGCAGWRHFVHATQTVLHHELAILATAVLVAAITWGGANQVGAWTFLVLWAMRVSAKLNLFLGVPNLAEELLPAHLDHLKSYLAKRPMNLLFPVSVTVATVVTALLALEAVAAGAAPFDVAAFTFLAALMALAVVEHWFLVLPVPDTALWRWALGSRARGGSAQAAGHGGPGDAHGRLAAPAVPARGRSVVARRAQALAQARAAGARRGAPRPSAFPLHRRLP